MSLRTAAPRSIVEILASKIDAYHRCRERADRELANSLEPDRTWIGRHAEAIAQCAKDCLPSGSGVDSGTTVDVDASTADRIVLAVPFHHMDQHGMYAGWTDYTIVLRPSFIGGVDVQVKGRDRNGIKDYLAEMYQYRVRQLAIETYDTETERVSFQVSE